VKEKREITGTCKKEKVPFRRLSGEELRRLAAECKGKGWSCFAALGKSATVFEAKGVLYLSRKEPSSGIHKDALQIAECGKGEGGGGKEGG